MGTNYYVKTEQKPACPHCGHQETVEPLHIGKSSGGWRFIFAPYPEHGLDTWKAWQAYLADKGIVDEYGADVPLAELVDWVEKKQRDKVSSYDRLDPDGYSFSTTADFC